MIMPRENSVAVLAGDGRRGVLDIEELEGKLIRSFLAVGLAEPWVAEDIAMAVEAALAHSQRRVGDEVPMSIPEVDRFVVKTLEDVGFPEAADNYRRQSDVPGEPFDAAAVAALAAEYLGLGGRAGDELAAEVVAACAALGIDSPGRGLVVELARHLRLRRRQSPPELASPITVSAIPLAEGCPMWLLESGAVAARMSGDTRALAGSGAIRVNNVSRIFPAVKVDVDLAKFAALLGLRPPLTELAFYPPIKRLAAAVDELAAACRGILSMRPAELPLYLKIIRSDHFAREFFNSAPAPAVPAFVDLLDYLRGSIGGPVEKVSCR